MSIIRVKQLSDMPKGRGLKPLPCPSFKEARRLARDTKRTIYYYRRIYTKKFPPLLFEEIKPEEPKPAPQPEPIVLEQLTLLEGM